MKKLIIRLKNFTFRNSNKTIEAFRNITKFIASLFDYSDIEFLAGFCLFAYGLYKLFPCLSYIVCGVLIMIIAQVRGMSKKRSNK